MLSIVGFDREESSWSNTNTDKEILGGQVEKNNENQ